MRKESTAQYWQTDKAKLFIQKYRKEVMCERWLSDVVVEEFIEDCNDGAYDLNEALTNNALILLDDFDWLKYHFGYYGCCMDDDDDESLEEEFIENLKAAFRNEILHRIYK